jgi:hypothetical protein
MKKLEAKVLLLLKLTDRFGTGKVATGGLTMQINNGMMSLAFFISKWPEDVMSSPSMMMEKNDA